MLEIISSLAVFMTSDKVVIAGEVLLEGFSLSQKLPNKSCEHLANGLKNTVYPSSLCLFLLATKIFNAIF